MSTLKAVIYVRVSTDEQAESGTSLETQELTCLRRAAALGAAVVATHRDEGVSGALYVSRPGIQAALRELEAGRAELLIVASLSRFSRDAEHQQAIRKRIERAGARLILCDMEIADTPEGDLQFGIMGQFAQYEKAVIRTRTMAGRLQRAQQGLQPARTQSPIGYHIVTKPDVLSGAYLPEQLGRYIVIEEEACVVRALFDKCAAGTSLRNLARWMNAQGVKTQRGGRCWYPTTVRYVLENTVYIGRPIFGKFQWRTDESRLEKALNPVYSKRGPEADQVILACEPIIDQALWNLCQERRKEFEAFRAPTPRKYLLTGLLRCAQCRRCMASASDGKTGYLYFHCIQSKPSDSMTGHVCSWKWHRSDKLEQWLIRDLRFLARRPERFADALTTYTLKCKQAQQQDSSAEVEGLRCTLTDLDSQETSTARAQVDALMKGRSTEVYDRLLTEIDTKRKQMQKRLTVLTPTQAPEAPLDCATEAEKIAEILRRFDAVLMSDELSAVEKNGVLSTFIRAIWPQEEGYSLELRLPKSSPSLGSQQMISTQAPPGAST